MSLVDMNIILNHASRDRSWCLLSCHDYASIGIAVTFSSTYKATLPISFHSCLHKRRELVFV